MRFPIQTSQQMPPNTQPKPCPVCGDTSAKSPLGRRGDGKTVKQCVRCGCGILDAELTAETVAAFYGETYFKELHSAYFHDLNRQVKDPNNLSNLLLNKISKFKSLQNTQFLDIGCAAGVLLATARNRGSKVTGLEISEAASTMARHVFNLDVRYGTLRNQAFSPASFDVICMIDVVEHLLTPRDDVQKVSELLKGGGILCILTPNLRAYRIFGKRWHGFNASYEHILYFDRKSLVKLLKSYGLKPILVETYGMVHHIQYYFPSLYRILPSQITELLNRICAKGLRFLGAEHRLLLIAQKSP